MLIIPLKRLCENNFKRKLSEVIPLKPTDNILSAIFRVFNSKILASDKDDTK